MVKFLLIALGGAIGTVLRYIVSGLDYKHSSELFPLSTLVINLTGSLIIGFLWGIFEKAVIPPNIRLFLFIGILGGFTTFSTFCLESFNLLRDGEIKVAFLNIVLSNFFGIVFVFVGFFIAKFLTSAAK